MTTTFQSVSLSEKTDASSSSSFNDQGVCPLEPSNNGGELTVGLLWQQLLRSRQAVAMGDGNYEYENEKTVREMEAGNMGTCVGQALQMII